MEHGLLCAVLRRGHKRGSAALLGSAISTGQLSGCARGESGSLRYDLGGRGGAPGVIGLQLITLGPFWITTTVVLILFLSSTIAQYFARMKDVPYIYDFGLLSGAAGLMYGYTAVVPVALWGVLKWYGSESANLLECLALYGYANLIWVPVAIASASPLTSNCLSWLLSSRGGNADE